MNCPDTTKLPIVRTASDTVVAPLVPGVMSYSTIIPSDPETQHGDINLKSDQKVVKLIKER